MADKTIPYHGAYRIVDPASLKAVPRTEFMQSICGAYDLEPMPIEHVISEAGNVYYQHPVFADNLTLQLAREYINHSNNNARLPKFGKWATGMYKDRKELAKDIADFGQKASKDKRVLHISGDPYDILRSGISSKFFSCLKLGGGFDQQRVLQRIVEECAGIAVAFFQDPDSPEMTGRLFLHHVKRKDGSDAIVCQSGPRGNLHAKNIVEVLKTKGIAVSEGNCSLRKDDMGVEPVEFQECFTENLHYDIYTWCKPFYCVMSK